MGDYSKFYSTTEVEADLLESANEELKSKDSVSLSYKFKAMFEMKIKFICALVNKNNIYDNRTC